LIRFFTKWSIRFGIIGGTLLFGYLVYLYFEIGHQVEPLVRYNPPKTTQIFDRNGKLLANVFDREHRIYVPYNEIPGRVVEALVAIEDTLFFEHHGVNPEAIFRAIIKDIKARKMVEGASTLTQQLVKSTLLTFWSVSRRHPARTIRRAIMPMRWPGPTGSWNA